MAPVRPFRFVAGLFTAASGSDWAERARRIEALGYSTVAIGDHFSPQFFAAMPALTAAALSTSTLRVACTVFSNDFRHPALLAKEAATLDLLSDGRLDFGIGAGWVKPEYDRAGIPFESPGTRAGRLEESVLLIKALWAGGPVNFAGHYYTISGLENSPKPLQQPHPPIFIGAGGKRLLSFAAREADIVGIIARALPTGGLALPEDTESLLGHKVDSVRAEAGDRFEHLELAVLIWKVAVTDRPRAAAEEIGRLRGLTADQVLASPYFLIGSTDAIVDRLQALRQRYGISHISIFPEDVDSFAPVVAQLAGS